MSSYLDDEQDIADEAEAREFFDSHALDIELGDLPELHPVVSLSPTDSVRTAITAMVEQRVGCILIVSEGRLVGVFSERDVLRKVAAASIDLDAVPVGELMTANPASLRPGDMLVYALHQMEIGGYRHVPLVDESGAPVAVVSMRDIVGYIVSLYPDEVLKLPSHPGQVISQTREGA
jgi:CBS domain-containing protein